MIKPALGPPEPELLLSAGFALRFLATFGTRSAPSVPSSGLSRLSVGGTIWSRIARMQKIVSTAPAPPRKWPMADLVELLETLPLASPNRRLNAPRSIVSATDEEPRSEERGGGTEGGRTG